jgi:hypothetical protein
LLEDFCPDTFSIAGNRGTQEMGITLQVHGQRLIEGNEYELDSDKNNNDKRYFYIHYQDHSKYSRNNYEGDLGELKMSSRYENNENEIYKDMGSRPVCSANYSRYYQKIM